MRYYLANNFVLKRLETPAIYDIKEDELYELDETAFEFLNKCSATEGCNGDDADREFIGYCLSEGILSEAPVSILRSRPGFLGGDLPAPSLRYLELQITDRCNLECKHCYIDRPGSNELPAETIMGILDEFELMQGLRLMISGGEPVVHRDFRAINAMLPKYGFRKILFTNGLLLGREVLECLHVDEIQFSVDGMERGHDALRGSGTYKKVIRAIGTALGSGMDVSVATMIHRANVAEFAEMEEFFKSMGIRDWTVDVPSPAGRFKHNTLFHIRPDMAGQYLNYGFGGGGFHGGGEGYGCGHHLLSVLANGTVAKCAFYTHAPLGKVSDGLLKCRARLKPVKLEALECCGAACAVIDSCRGGCRYRASLTAGKSEWGENKRDIYKCFAYGILKAES